MVFKLIRVDSQEPCCKIKLALGKHLIGRGKFLHNDEKDKRVSRNHAELEVTDDLISLKSLHQNPCFYSKKNTTSTDILQQNDTLILSTGDKFGLLPDNYWYEVLQCLDSDVLEAITQSKDNETYNKDNLKDEVSDGKQDDELLNQNNINHKIEEEDVDSNKSSSLYLQSPTTEPVDQKSTETCAVSDTVNNSSPGSPNKRNHDSLDSGAVDSKRVKIEPASTNPQPGPSNDQPVSDVDGVQKPKIDPPVSPIKASVPLRERCIYGANCYRRNAEHKARFSHPADADWGQGARGVCPYGATCRRADPRHWLHHDHPPGVQQPQPAAGRPGHQRKKQIKGRASESEDDDDGDSPKSDLVVTGKRSRKTINRETWDISESEEEEDPYKTDESDEWQPSSDFTNTEDYSQNL